ncbi:alanine--tRNA ligase-like isoform X2 [Balamuthia mandrillaris]
MSSSSASGVAAVTLPPTVLVYWEDTYRFALEGAAKVLRVATAEDDGTDGKSVTVILDQTIFHPQGGGQPFDTGVIRSKTASFQVKETRFDRQAGVVLHKGCFAEEGTTFREGETVDLHIDEDKRRLHARLHSAGHLLDIAFAKVLERQTEPFRLVPGKGYHFPDGPYVEYKGNLPAALLEDIRQQLEQECNQMISLHEDPVQVHLTHSRSEAEAICGDDSSDVLPPPAKDGAEMKEEPIRIVVLLSGDSGKRNKGAACPCGGTHVKSIKEIGGMKVKRITSRKKVVRVKYSVLS